MIMLMMLMMLKMRFYHDDPLDDHDTHVKFGDDAEDEGDGDDHLLVSAHGHADFIVRTKLQQVRTEWQKGAVDTVFLAQCDMDAARERVLHSMAHTHEERQRAAFSDQSPWKIGDADYPVRPELIEKYMAEAPGNKTKFNSNRQFDCLQSIGVCCHDHIVCRCQLPIVIMNVCGINRNPPPCLCMCVYRGAFVCVLSTALLKVEWNQTHKLSG
jgi:hypothetical protein